MSAIYKPYKIRWYIGIRKRQKGILSYKGKFHILKNPKDGWCADPFIFEHNDKIYIFAEKWNYIKQKGTIVYREITQGENQWREVIEESYHLSYPNIWKDDTGIHICAETSSNGEIYIYTALSFPNVWKKDKVWWSGAPLADTTILFDENNLPQWLFTYGCSELVNRKLFRLKVDEEQETAKKLTFLSRDSRISRPGGKFIKENGHIYRIAQNCSESYGRSIFICKVTECTDNSYKEKILFERKFEKLKIDKKLKLIGMHTYNRSKEYEVVDFRVNKFNFIDMIFYIIKRMKY